MLSLDQYTENKRIYALKTDLGRNRVCKLCNFKRAVQDLKIVRLNEEGKFVIIEFENVGQVAEYFKQKNEL
jgi:formamidopyrimidine-DNA glycosylase